MKVVWRWKALLLSVISSGAMPLLIINNNNAMEHATCKDLIMLLKYESLIYSDIWDGRDEAWKHGRTRLIKVFNTQVEESKAAIQIPDLHFTGITPEGCSGLGSTVHPLPSPQLHRGVCLCRILPMSWEDLELHIWFIFSNVRNPGRSQKMDKAIQLRCSSSPESIPGIPVVLYT